MGSGSLSQPLPGLSTGAQSTEAAACLVEENGEGRRRPPFPVMLPLPSLVCSGLGTGALLTEVARRERQREGQWWAGRCVLDALSRGAGRKFGVNCIPVGGLGARGGDEGMAGHWGGGWGAGGAALDCVAPGPDGEKAGFCPE